MPRGRKSKYSEQAIYDIIQLHRGNDDTPGMGYAQIERSGLTDMPYSVIARNLGKYRKGQLDDLIARVEGGRVEIENPSNDIPEKSDYALDALEKAIEAVKDAVFVYVEAHAHRLIDENHALKERVKSLREELKSQIGQKDQLLEDANEQAMKKRGWRKKMDGLWTKQPE